MKEVYDKNRMINFSDVVFSIVMRLFILEVGVPAAGELRFSTFTKVLSNYITDFIGMFVIFLVSGLYWIGHTRLFGYVSKVTGKLLWLHIFFLLAIVLLIWFLVAFLAIKFTMFSKVIFILLFINQFFIDRYFTKKLKAS